MSTSPRGPASDDDAPQWAAKGFVLSDGRITCKCTFGATVLAGMDRSLSLRSASVGEGVHRNVNTEVA